MCIDCKQIFDKTTLGKQIPHSFDFDVDEPQDWQRDGECVYYWMALRDMGCIEIDFVDRGDIVYYMKYKLNPTDV